MKVSSLSKISFFFLFLYDLISYNSFGISQDTFFILIYLSLISSALIFFKPGIFNELDKFSKKLFFLVCFFFIFSFIRGIIFANGYFDLKYIFTNVYGGSSLISISFILIGVSVSGFFSVIKLINKYLHWVSIPLLIMNIYLIQIFPRVAISIFVLLLMFGYLNKKNKVISVLLGIASFILSIEWRSNVIRLLFSFLTIAAGFNYRFFYKLKKGLLFSMFLIPLLGIYYSVQNESVFQLKFLSESFISNDFSVDTRTLLYTEVFDDLFNTNTFFFGKGILGNYKSEIFDFADGRIQVEVGFLKYLLQIGFIGFFILSLLMFRAAFLGIKYSNNKLSKIFSVFIAFHFCFLFVEAIPAFGQYYFFVWAIVGLLLSRKFRSFSDSDISTLLYAR